MTTAPSIPSPATILVLGAGSGIAEATARRLAAADRHLVLAGRTPALLADIAADLKLRGGGVVEVVAFDALDVAGAVAFVDRLPAIPDLVLCAVGVLGDQGDAQRDPVVAAALIAGNFTGPAVVLGVLAERMAARGSGVIVAIGSVAGDRGRATNYIYGSAKAGFAAFLSGLRARLCRSGVRVITVKPGFVRTRMTEGLPLPPPLTAEPDEVARAILRAVDRHQDVIYVRPVWRIVMAIIRALPEPMFKRLKL